MHTYKQEIYQAITATFAFTSTTQVEVNAEPMKAELRSEDNFKKILYSRFLLIEMKCSEIKIVLHITCFLYSDNIGNGKCRIKID